MQRSISKLATFLLVILAFHKVALSKQEAAGDGSNYQERAILFAIQQEVRASDLGHKRDLCLALGGGLDSQESRYISNLRRSGLLVHGNDWCAQGPRGTRIAVIGPVTKTSPTEYQIVVQVDDLSLHPGEHFATTLKRGTYTIRSEQNAKSQLVSYEQTCCSK